MYTLRLPSMPDSVMGVRPAVKSIGMLSLLALMSPMIEFAVPTETWTMTSWGRPVTMV